MSGRVTDIVVEAPLRGEWTALHTPAHRVPSHGTNYLGQRYAFDFIQVGGNGLPYDSGLLRHLFWVQPADAFVCWGQKVYSVFDGVVAAVGENWPDRRRINLVLALAGSSVRAPSPAGTDIRPLAGNHVIIEGERASAFYAHLQCGSVSLRTGDAVRTGDVLGRVGNSGNSTMPHLHFHLMDRSEIQSAQGLPCRFRRLERFADGAWVAADNAIPERDEPIRWG
jgi:hypothetical protein